MAILLAIALTTIVISLISLKLQEDSHPLLLFLLAFGSGIAVSIILISEANLSPLY